MKPIHLILLILVLPLFSNGQHNYIKTDSTVSIGIKIINNGEKINSEICQVKTRNDSTITYTPDDIVEYGFKDGSVYVSKTIYSGSISKKVFLQKLNHSKTTLYLYRNNWGKTFFVERDSTFIIEIPYEDKDNTSFRNTLSQITNDCDNSSEAIGFVKYNKYSLLKLISMHDNCEYKPFPHFRYGVIIGYELLKFSPVNKNDRINLFDFSSDGSFSTGAFIDNPIRSSDFSLHTELLYSKHGYSYNTFDGNEQLDLAFNVSTLKIPLLVRYTYPSNKIRPFFNSGLTGIWNFKNDNFFIKSSFSENTVELNWQQNFLTVNDFLWGICVGSGIEYKLNYKNSLFFEMRYCKQVNIPKTNTLIGSEIEFLVGINL